MFLYSCEVRLLQGGRQRARLRKAEHTDTVGLRREGGNVPPHNSHGGKKIWLLEGAPGQQSYASLRAQDTAGFAEGARDVVEKHHAKATGDAIKALGRKRQCVSIGLSELDIFQAPLLGAGTRDLEQFRIGVNSDDSPFYADLGGQADGRLTCAASQVEHLHPRPGRSELNDGLSDGHTHSGRLASPFLRSSQTKAGTPGS
jgi:hypothetical protein